MTNKRMAKVFAWFIDFGGRIAAAIYVFFYWAFVIALALVAFVAFVSVLAYDKFRELLGKRNGKADDGDRVGPLPQSATGLPEKKDEKQGIKPEDGGTFNDRYLQ